MARVLYTSWLSPFARKVALALELKGLAYDAVDGLTREFRSSLQRANPRAEVPVLLDDGITVVNSSDILQYLDWRYPTPALYPEGIADRVTARALERLADQRVDPIIVDCSLWLWAERSDQRPEGLMAAGQEDLEWCLQRLEDELAPRTRPAVRLAGHSGMRVVCKPTRGSSTWLSGPRGALSHYSHLAGSNASASHIRP